jgi:hypothetical protein
MRLEERWQWWVRDPLKSKPKLHRSRWHMTEEQAKKYDPEARRVEGSRKVVEVAETREELAARSHGAGAGGVSGHTLEERLRTAVKSSRDAPLLGEAAGDDESLHGG